MLNPKTNHVVTYISRVSNESEVVAADVELSEELARLLSFCIHTAWSELTVDEKVTAEKFLHKINGMLREE